MEPGRESPIHAAINRSSREASIQSDWIGATLNSGGGEGRGGVDMYCLCAVQSRAEHIRAVVRESRAVRKIETSSRQRTGFLWV